MEKSAEFCTLEKGILSLKDQIDALAETDDLGKKEKIATLRAEIEKEWAAILPRLTTINIVQIARHPKRPYTLDYIAVLFQDFMEMHGDRRFADDPAIVAGLAFYKGRTVAVIGHQKGRTTRARIDRNFGQANPEGYRKALRVMQEAEKFCYPVITFIDTPGAYPGIGAEERGQAEAIANNLKTIARLKVPIINVVIGEGGSGGGLGIGFGDQLMMLEHSFYSVISPEGCAAIVWKDQNGRRGGRREPGHPGEDAARVRHHRQDHPRAARRGPHRPRADLQDRRQAHLPGPEKARSQVPRTDARGALQENPQAGGLRGTVTEDASARKELAAIKGTRDILPGEVEKWQVLEGLARTTFELYGFRELRAPVFEATELFEKGSGSTSDVVTKEMYTFIDKGGRSLTLRPEYTPSVVRAIIEHRLDLEGAPMRYYFMGPMFRYDKPQKGRYRQFHQIDIEVFGEKDAAVDAEIIEMAHALLGKLGVGGTETLVNTVGCRACRPAYSAALREAAAKRKSELCVDCQRKAETNPLRIFDCKVEACREIARSFPLIQEFLCDECRDHFRRLLACLDVLKIAYRVDPRLVRGLDYYTKTTFEIVTAGIGAQNALLGGGRYDDMMKDFGGPDICGTGFAMGIERVLSVAELAPPARKMLYLAYLGDRGQDGGVGPGPLFPVERRRVPGRIQGPGHEGAFRPGQQAPGVLGPHRRRGRIEERPLRPQGHGRRHAVRRHAARTSWPSS